MSDAGGKRLSRGFLLALGAFVVFLFVFGVLVLRVRAEANERWTEAELALEATEIGRGRALRTFDRGVRTSSGGFSTYQHRYRNWSIRVFDLTGAGDEDAASIQVTGVEFHIDGEPAGFSVQESIRVKLEQQRAWLYSETWTEIVVLEGELDSRLVREAQELLSELGFEPRVVDERVPAP